MTRTPPIEVRRELRREVGFGCPVEGCGRPYLTWHHFDPPWRDREHQEPGGMIALCREHADRADGGAFTIEQLRALKGNAARGISGQFDWMRQDLLAVVGGNFYFRTPNPVVLRDRPVVSFGRDEDQHWLLNIDMPTTSSEPRLQMKENFWIVPGTPQDVECPPQGRLLAVKYANGDKIKVEFVADLDLDGLQARYPNANTPEWNLPGTVAVVEIEMLIAGTGLEFGPRSTRIGDSIMMIDNFTHGAWAGLHIG
jgi:hypothetical protein